MELTIYLKVEDKSAKDVLRKLLLPPSNENPLRSEGETYQLFLVYEDTEVLREIPINNIIQNNLGWFKFKVKLKQSYVVDSFNAHIKLEQCNGDGTTTISFYKNDNKEKWIVRKPQDYCFLSMDLKEKNKTTVESKTKPIEAASEDDPFDENTESSDEGIVVEDLPLGAKGIIGQKKEVHPQHQHSSTFTKFTKLLSNLSPFKQRPGKGIQVEQKITSSESRKNPSATSSGSSLSTDSSNATTRTSSPTRGGR